MNKRQEEILNELYHISPKAMGLVREFKSLDLTDKPVKKAKKKD